MNNMAQTASPIIAAADIYITDHVAVSPNKSMSFIGVYVWGLATKEVMLG